MAGHDHHDHSEGAALACIPLILLACGLKLYGAYLSGSVALLGDGLDSLLDIVGVAAAVHLYRRSRLPPDEEHPYGHGGLEVFAAVVSCVLIGASMALIGSAIFYSLGEHRVAGVGVYYSAASTLVLLGLVALAYTVSRSGGSMALRAEVRHLLGDLAESVVVLGGVYLAVSTHPLFDIATAIAILALLARGLALNLREVYSCVTFEQPDSRLHELVSEAALQVEGVSDVHRVRLKRLGEHYHADLHLRLAPDTPVERAHRIVHEVEEAILKRIRRVREVLVHVEPARERERG